MSRQVIQPALVQTVFRADGGKDVRNRPVQAFAHILERSVDGHARLVLRLRVEEPLIRRASWITSSALPLMVSTTAFRVFFMRHLIPSSLLPKPLAVPLDYALGRSALDASSTTGRYRNASPTCRRLTTSMSSRSAIVRATRNTR